MSTFDHSNFLKNVPHKPGIYQMFNAQQKLLYVGKAKDLRKRVASYFRITGQLPKTQSLVAQIADIKIIVVGSETEALLLEYNLIKTFKPHYNILLRDDKSYPYLFLSHHEFPCLSVYRGAKKAAGEYFGPFASGQAVHETRMLLQRIFKLRQCQDSVFKARSRPCLQYQIGRCSAPCVRFISAEEYARNVGFVRLFLTGKSKVIISQIKKLMQEASQQLDFELAAYYRDQLTNLRQVQQQQCVIYGADNIDVVVVIEQAGFFCIDVLLIRNGLVLGNKTFVHELNDTNVHQEKIASFLTQYYANQNAVNLPQRVVTNVILEPKNRAAIIEALQQITEQKIQILPKITRNIHKQWLQLALTNAELVLQQQVAQRIDLSKVFFELQQILSLAHKVQRIECFDVSHHSGEATVVSRVVFTAEGVCKEEYRRYNIKNAAAGDDYAALHEALTRRFYHSDTISEELKTADSRQVLPNVLMIDGGKGQLQVAANILTERQKTDIAVLAVAKGEGRKRGAETIYFLHNNKIINLTLPQAAFNFLLRVRDEAHRFAITGQRQKMRKTRAKK